MNGRIFWPQDELSLVTLYGMPYASAVAGTVYRLSTSIV